MIEKKTSEGAPMHRPRGRGWGLMCGLPVLLALAAPARADEFIVTPWTAASTTETLMTCTDCALGAANSVGTHQSVYFKSVAKGLYSIRFAGGAPSGGSKVAVHVTPLGYPGVTCVPSFAGVTNGTDYTVGVTCRKGTTAVNTRFMLDLINGSSSWSGPGAAFANLRSGVISPPNTWSSSGQTPTFTHPSTGVYQFQFPGLTDTTSGGNAQVVSMDINKHCSLQRWGVGASASSVDIKCYDASNNLVDSDQFVTFTQLSGFGSLGNTGFIWSQLATGGTFTPAAQYNRGAGVTAGPTPPPMTVNHYATGRYQVDVGTSAAPLGFGGLTGIHARVSPWGTTATCNVSDIDVHFVTVACSDASGAPVDAVFSLLYRNDNTLFQRGFFQVPVTGTNYNATFDAGNGLICGTSPTQNGNIICVVPSAKSTTSDARPVGGGPPPGGAVKSVAVSNVDASSANVLVLGSDNVVYATTGKLSPTWDPTTNFVSWTTYVRPVDSSGASVSLKKIVSVRATSVSGDGVFTIVGLTTGGKAVLTHGPGEAWTPFTITGNANDTFKDITHSRDDIYALLTNGTMVWSSFSGGFGGLPPLPNGLSVIALGGRYAMSNAGLSNGLYPCTGPKDSFGNYNCAGATQRVFRLETNNVWMPMLSTPMTSAAEPTVNQDDVLTGGDPLASVSPTIVDAEAFEGNWGTFLVYQYFHRVYQRDP